MTPQFQWLTITEVYFSLVLQIQYGSALVLCHFLHSRTKAEKQSLPGNIVHHCDLRGKMKFVSLVQFCKVTGCKRTISLYSPFIDQIIVICLFLVQRAGTQNTPPGRTYAGRVIQSTVRPSITTCLHFHGRKAMDKRNNLLQETLYKFFHSTILSL